MTTKKTGLELLREPFPENQISIVPKPTKIDNPKGKCSDCGKWHGLPAVHLNYVGHAAITDRLLDVDPLWTWEPLAIGQNGLPVFDENGGLWIKLTVCGHSRLGYGHSGDKKGGDAVKEIIGDCLRNAAMRFGAALDLWHNGELHVTDEYENNEPVEISNEQYIIGRVNEFAMKFPELSAELSKLPKENKMTMADKNAIFGGSEPLEQVSEVVVGFLQVRR